MAGEALWRPRRQCDSSRVAQPGLSALKQTVRSPSLANLMAEELGFEPKSSVLETDSLPLLLFLCGRYERPALPTELRGKILLDGWKAPCPHSHDRLAAVMVARDRLPYLGRVARHQHSYTAHICHTCIGATN